MRFRPGILMPHYVEKAWGGQTLHEVFGAKLPFEKTGESWQVSALKEGESLYEGRPLSEWIEKYGSEFVGTEINPVFPLLIKLLDAREPLSVQVHPDDAYAQKVHGDPYGKNEAWVVLRAEEGATLIVGYDGSDEDLRRSAYDGTLGKRLCTVPVHTGDALYIPAGTVHAIGRGILIYEIQQPSDRTYRFYAYDRPGVALDREKALDMAKQTGVSVMSNFVYNAIVDENGKNAGEKCTVFDTPYFSLSQIRCTGKIRENSDRAAFCCYTVTEGKGILSFSEGELPYKAGETIFVPAGVGEYTLEGGVLLRADPPRKGKEGGPA